MEGERERGKVKGGGGGETSGGESHSINLDHLPTPLPHLTCDRLGVKSPKVLAVLLGEVGDYGRQACLFSIVSAR